MSNLKYMMGSGILALLFLTPGLQTAWAADPGIDPATASPDSVFSTMVQAWQQGDEVALAGLVHANGLRVTHGGDYDRFTTYSPDQAFYYFQDLFRTHTTVEFGFRRLTEPLAEGPVLGMVEWKFLLPGREYADQLKLVVVLDHDGPRWRFTEFNSISQR